MPIPGDDTKKWDPVRNRWYVPGSPQDPANLPEGEDGPASTESTPGKGGKVWDPDTGTWYIPGSPEDPGHVEPTQESTPEPTIDEEIAKVCGVKPTKPAGYDKWKQLQAGGSDTGGTR